MAEDTKPKGPGLATEHAVAAIVLGSLILLALIRVGFAGAFNVKIGG